MLSSDPATAIGMRSRTVIKLNPEEMSIVVRCVKLQTQAVEGVAEVVHCNGSLANVWSCVVKANSEGKAPADIPCSILNPECVTLLSTLAQIVKTKGPVVPTGQ